MTESTSVVVQGWGGRDWLQMGMRELSGMVEMFYIFIRVEAAQIPIYQNKLYTENDVVNCM